MRSCLLLALLVLIAFPAGAAPGKEATADGVDWPRWRGQDGSGVSPETSWAPEKLQKLTFAWQASVGGGYSGVCVVGDRLYTVGSDGDAEVILCLDARNGKRVWSHSYRCSSVQYPGPRATPAVDGDLLYSLGQVGRLLCLNRRTGAVVWERRLIEDLGVSIPGWGFASSPIVWEDLLLLNAGRAGVALDKKSGELVWGEPGTGGYASIVFQTVEGRTVAVVFGQKALYGVDPRTGAEAWSFPWRTANDANTADPLVVGDRLFVSSDYGSGCALLGFAGGEVTLEWRSPVVSSHFSSFLFLDGAIFANDGDALAHRGAFVCLDPAAGAVRWKADLGVGSLLAAGGRLILLTEKGSLRVAEASASDYREIVSAQLPLGLYWTAPVLSQGKLYIRNLRGELFCIDLRP